MTRRNAHEDALQKSVMRYLRTILPRGSVVWAVPNGGKMSAAARMRQAAMGEVPGVSDIMFVVPSPMHCGRLHCLELKLRRGPLSGIPRTTYQSKAQKQFQSDIEAAGGRYAVARDLGDVNVTVRLWGIPIKESK